MQYFSIKVSKILKGEKGIFVNSTFKIDEPIMKIRGNIVSERSKYTIQCGPNEHIVPIDKFGNPTGGYYVNHSCEPNSKINIVRKNKIKPYILVTVLRELKAEEELTLDYACMEYTTTIDGTECKCGTVECRGVITGYKDLPLEIKDKYISHGLVPDYLIELDKINS